MTRPLRILALIDTLLASLHVLGLVALLTLSTFHSNSSPICHLLSTPLLHLRLSLALRPRLWHPRCISKPLPRSHKRRVRQPNRIHGHHNPQPPCPVSKHSSQQHAPVRPVRHIPHVLCQPFRFQIFAAAFHGAIGVVSWTAKSLKLELDEELWGGEEGVEEEGASGEG